MRRPTSAAPAGVIAASLVAIGLSACAGRSLEVGIQTLAREVPATQAMALPPPGGPSIVTVIERRASNGVEQEIVLSTVGNAPGQNALYITLLDRPQVAEGEETRVRVPSLEPDAIQAEMERRLPGIDMAVSSYFVQNKYGPFGYAAGRSGLGDTCVYAWQTIEPNKQTLLSPRGAIGVRLRLCEPGAPEEALLRVMYDFSVIAHIRSPGWNPYGDPPRPNPSLGETGAPVYPLSRNGHTRPVAGTVDPLPPVVVQRVVRTAPAPLRPIEPAEAPGPRPATRQEPLEGFPTVPPPP